MASADGATDRVLVTLGPHGLIGMRLTPVSGSCHG